MNVIRAYCLWTPITSVLLKEKQNQIKQVLDTARQLYFVSLLAKSQSFAQVYDKAGENLSRFLDNEDTGLLWPGTLLWKEPKS